VVYFDKADWGRKKIKNFNEIKSRFFDAIDKLYGGHEKVGLIGISAGGPLTLEGLAEADVMVHKVATYAGCNRPLTEVNRKYYEKTLWR